MTLGTDAGTLPPVTPGLPPELDPRRPARKNRWLRGIAAAASAAVLASSAVGYVGLTHYTDKINRVDVFAGLSAEARPAKVPTKAVNILLVGSDSRQGLTDAEIGALHVGINGDPAASGRRSDTMILLHLDADWQRATLISFPRDSYLTIPAHTDSTGKQVKETRNKLNAAFAVGGPELTIATIEQATGLRIDHYAEVGFDGFVKAVDAVGGVEVCTEKPIKDQKSGLNLPAGVSRLDGSTSLSYVRARYFDPTADIGRMGRQQAFLASLFREATSSGVLLNPVRLNGLLDATLSSVTTDPGMSRDMLMAIATKMRSMTGDNVVFLTVPISDAGYSVPNVGSTVLWDTKQANALFQAIRTDAPIGTQTAGGTAAATTTAPAADAATVAPGTIKLKVLNGTATSGLARKSADALAAVGFTISSTGNTQTVSTTEIRYDPRWSESVKTVAAALPGARLVPVPNQGGTFEVVIGDPAQQVLPVTLVAASSTAPSAAPSASASAGGGLATSSAADPLCGSK